MQKNDKKCVTKYNRIKAVEIIGSANQKILITKKNIVKKDII